MAWRGELACSIARPYIGVQLPGALLGTWPAHAMFNLPLLQFSSKLRGGTRQWIAETVATAGLGWGLSHGLAPGAAPGH